MFGHFFPHSRLPHSVGHALNKMNFQEVDLDLVVATVLYIFQYKDVSFLHMTDELV
jgi:hypothetical protein